MHTEQQQLLLQASVALKQHRPRACQKILKRFQRAYGFNKSLVQIYFQLYSETNNWEKAVSFLEQVLRRYPQEGVWHYYLAQAFKMLDQKNNYQQHLLHCSRLNKKFAPAFLELAHIAIDKQQSDAAYALINHYISLGHKEPETLLTKAQLAFICADYREVILTCNQLPDSVEINLLKTKALKKYQHAKRKHDGFGEMVQPEISEIISDMTSRVDTKDDQSTLIKNQYWNAFQIS